MDMKNGIQTDPLKWSRDLIMSIHLGTVFFYLCFILYRVSEWDQTNDINLRGLST